MISSVYKKQHEKTKKKRKTFTVKHHIKNYEHPYETETHLTAGWSTWVMDSCGCHSRETYMRCLWTFANEGWDTSGRRPRLWRQVCHEGTQTSTSPHQLMALPLYSHLFSSSTSVQLQAHSPVPSAAPQASFPSQDTFWPSKSWFSLQWFLLSASAFGLRLLSSSSSFLCTPAMTTKGFFTFCLPHLPLLSDPTTFPWQGW